MGSEMCIRDRDARDVTMEYVDLDSRIANKKKLEGRVSELLGNSRGDVKDLIRIEHELASIREQIEVMEGRLRKLKDLSATTTVTVTMVERKPDPVVVVAEPPAPPTFTERVDSAWMASVSSTRKIYENLVVWFAGNLIPLIAFFVGCLLVIAFVRLTRKYVWWASRQIHS